jgi:DNA-binding SARP family transcriptional activator
MAVALSQELAMGTKTHTKNKRDGGPLLKEIDWRAICQMLTNGQYEAVSRILSSGNIPPQQVDPYLNPIFASAYQICLACQQVHKEAERNREAFHKAVQRERELQQELTLLFDLIEQYTKSGKAVNPTKKQISETLLNKQQEPPVNENGRTWWQRLQTTFNRFSNSRDSPTATQQPIESPTQITDEAIRLSPIEETLTPDLTIYCLGPFRAYLQETRVREWHGNNAKAIFKYMIINREWPIPTEILMDLFWRDDEPESARRNLYQAIYLLRQALQVGSKELPYVLSTNGCYGLNPELTIWLDCELFEAYYQNGQKFERDQDLAQARHEYEAAEALYEGDFLAEDIYEEWPIPRRQQLKNAHLDILSRLSHFYYGQRNWTMGNTYSQKLLHIDNCREDAHRDLMQAYVNMGQRHLALRQYHHCVDALQDELGAIPSPQTNNLYQQIKENHLQF